MLIDRKPKSIWDILKVGDLIKFIDRTWRVTRFDGKTLIMKVTKPKGES